MVTHYSFAHSVDHSAAEGWRKSESKNGQQSSLPNPLGHHAFPFRKKQSHIWTVCDTGHLVITFAAAAKTNQTE